MYIYIYITYVMYTQSTVQSTVYCIFMRIRLWLARLLWQTKIWGRFIACVCDFSCPCYHRVPERFPRFGLVVELFVQSSQSQLSWTSQVCWTKCSHYLKHMWCTCQLMKPLKCHPRYSAGHKISTRPSKNTKVSLDSSCHSSWRKQHKYGWKLMATMAFLLELHKYKAIY